MNERTEISDSMYPDSSSADCRDSLEDRSRSLESPAMDDYRKVKIIWLLQNGVVKPVRYWDYVMQKVKEQRILCMSAIGDRPDVSKDETCIGNNEGEPQWRC